MFLHHICIATSCYKDSLNFYTNLLGMKLLAETKNFHGREYNTWLEGNGIKIELQTAKNGETLREYDKESNGIVHICFMVDDIDKVYKSFKEKGFANFLQKENKDIYQVFDTKLFKIAAPEGTIIEFRDKEI